MCLAVPMRVVALEEGSSCRVAIEESESIADISLLGDVQVGDYIIVHAGFAIEKLKVEEAEARLELFKELAKGHGID
ncbi:MAG: HypC/HybG/HupF family hydrogenase formation chaperone [Planctomycetes bacterium]|nr:HypC/HybG/HupF family hydrogenase formation chaperone [Planctomycetota bacterium]